MQEWIVLLKAINVSGTGKLPMAALRDILSQHGFEDVRTYIQSGNIILKTALSADRVTKIIADILRDSFELERVPLLLRPKDLREAILCNPFQDDDIEPKNIHIIFSNEVLSFDSISFQQYCLAGERAELINNFFYLHTPNGAGRSKAMRAYDRYFNAQHLTARNLNSCQKILALCEV